MHLHTDTGTHTDTDTGTDTDTDRHRHTHSLQVLVFQAAGSRDWSSPHHLAPQLQLQTQQLS